MKPDQVEGAWLTGVGWSLFVIGLLLGINVDPLFLMALGGALVLVGILMGRES